VRDDRLGFLVDAIGPGTDRLATLERDEGIWLVGPLGIGFSAPPAGATPLLVAGGVGLAPLVILAESLTDAGHEPRALAGFRSAAHAEAARLLPAAPELATDDGSAGHHGFVTELLRKELERSRQVFLYACGPPAMLESVRALCAELDVTAELALEEAMACGFGACFGCVVATRDGYRRICVDGPVVCATDLEEAWLEH
jgi:NAD(P)H-flavin reductase